MNENLFTRLFYENDLTKSEDVNGFILEGSAVIDFPNSRMRMKNALDPALEQQANYVFWCPLDFPSDIKVTWDFYPVREPGLCMMLFAATGINGEDIFDEKLQKRTGEYNHYNNGDINMLHVSYFRRRYKDDRSLNVCNLRKSKGFHLAATGADPIPSVENCISPYRIKLIKQDNEVAFFINDLQILYWADDGKAFGQVYKGGKIGFRQMAPLIAEYQNFRVYTTE